METTPTTPANPSSASPWRGRIIKTLLALVLIPALLLAAYTWVSLTWSYSEGERTGFVQKISKKGWLCKTWEGELTLVAMPGAMPEKFYFTVRDEAVAERIARQSGARVMLRYKQHKGIPTTCFGETEYFVDGVQHAQQ
jgi:hypothetical protein